MKLLKGRSKVAKIGAGAGPAGPTVAEAAYFLAQQRGFEPGHEWEDWFQAEALLGQGGPTAIVD